MEANVLSNLSQCLHFVNNTATLGGDHIYGAVLKSDCVSSSYCHHESCRHSYETIKEVFFFDPDIGTTLSAVSGDPSRLCVCDVNGQPQCTNFSKIFYTEAKVCPGQPFVISVVLVGGDFGTTTGTAYANIADSNNSKYIEQHAQLIINNTQCTSLRYSILSNSSFEVMYLTATAYNFLHDSSIQNPTVLETYINNFTNNGVISHDLLYIPITVNVTLLSCPPGFTLIGDPPRCSCSSVLLNFNVECALDIGASYIAWSKLMWIGAKD